MSVELPAKSDTQTAGQARENLEAFVEASPSLEDYGAFTRAVYITHELPFAIASLIREFGGELYGSTDTEPPVYGFFNQRGLTQIQGQIGTRDGALGRAPIVTLAQKRPRMLRDPKLVRSTQLFLTRRPEVARVDQTYEAGQCAVRFSDLNAEQNVAFLERIKNQGGDSETAGRAMTARYVLDEQEAQRQISQASQTLAKLSQGLLRAVEPGY